MTQRDQVRAYIAASKLNRLTLPISIAKKVFTLVDRLQPSWDFQAQEEKKIYDAHPMYNPEIGGCIPEDDSLEARHKAEQEARLVVEALKQLAETEVEQFEFEPIEISEELQDRIELSGEEVGYLKPYITFK